MELQSSDARITTASVEIRVLTVNGKQMTLAVYRQLPSKRIVDRDTGQLRGEPWGWINHCPTSKCEKGSHIHVVFAEDGRLYESPVFASVYDHDAAYNYVGHRSNPRHYLNDAYGQSYADCKASGQLFIAV